MIKKKKIIIKTTAQTFWLIFEIIINNNRSVSSGFERPRRRRHYFNIAVGCGNVPTMQRTLSQRPFGMRSGDVVTGRIFIQS